MIHMTQKYLYLREEQRFHFEKLLWLWKQTWMWFEEHTQSPLRHLTKAQISEVLHGTHFPKSSFNEQHRWSEMCKLENTWSTSRLLD